MRGSWTFRGVLLIAGLAVFGCGARAVAATPKPVADACQQAVFEGDVKAGQGFEKVFAKGLVFYLEPITSGWIVRVLAEGTPRGPHDFAELATLPYNSVSPLSVSTDFAFRAQDAVGWNPRRFRYAQDAAAARQLSGLYDRVLASDAAASQKTTMLTLQQPEGELEILNAVIVPGMADQWRMAAAVALHFASTPHEVEQGAPPSPLGKIEKLQFRVRLQLPFGVKAESGEQVERIACPGKPL
jgi:hypothetical protein